MHQYAPGATWFSFLDDEHEGASPFHDPHELNPHCPFAFDNAEDPYLPFDTSPSFPFL
jgi:hypothetical protein